MAAIHLSQDWESQYPVYTGGAENVHVGSGLGVEIVWSDFIHTISGMIHRWCARFIVELSAPFTAALVFLSMVVAVDMGAGLRTREFVAAYLARSNHWTVPVISTALGFRHAGFPRLD